MNVSRPLSCLAISSALTAGLALSFQGHATADPPPSDEGRYGLSHTQWRTVPPFGKARLTDDDQVEIQIPGEQDTVRVHGLDGLTVADEPATGTQTGTNPTRSPVCSATSGEYRMVVLYAHPSDKASRYTSQIDRIRTLVTEMDYKLYSDAVASGGSTKGADYRVQCYSTGGIRVAELHSTTTSTQDLFGTIVADARAAGFNANNEKYLIWYDDPRPNYCGLGNLLADDTKTLTNASNGYQPQYAVVYGNGTNPNGTTYTCWARNAGMHENGHNMGAVQNSAPHSTQAGHCNDGSDIMCYADGGPAEHYTATTCTTSRPFDCGYDDYFDTSTEIGEYLVTHWNIGWNGNRFLVNKIPSAFTGSTG